MADNVTITAGAGTTIAADDIGGVLHQRTKLVWGTDGTAVDASATNPLPVTAPAATRSTHSIGAALQSDAVMANLTTLTPKFFSVTVTASQTDAVLVAAVSGKKIRVLALAIQCGATATISTIESDEASDVRKHKVPAGANGGQILPPNPWGWFETAAGSALITTTGAGSDTEYTGVYVEV